jgi:hypothetical protein
VTGVWKRSLIVRVGPDNYEEALLEPHVREFDITGRPMRGWVVVGPDGVVDDGQLSEWVRRAVQFVGTLPPKPTRGREGSMARPPNPRRRLFP